VSEMVARRDRGERINQMARELGVDRQALAEGGRMAAAASATPGAPTGSVRGVYGAARARGWL
jgi:hypothetical protein